MATGVWAGPSFGSTAGVAVGEFCGPARLAWPTTSGITGAGAGVGALGQTASSMAVMPGLASVTSMGSVGSDVDVLEASVSAEPAPASESKALGSQDAPSEVEVGRDDIRPAASETLLKPLDTDFITTAAHDICAPLSFTHSPSRSPSPYSPLPPFPSPASAMSRSLSPVADPIQMEGLGAQNSVDLDLAASGGDTESPARLAWSLSVNKLSGDVTTGEAEAVTRVEFSDTVVNAQSDQGLEAAIQVERQLERDFEPYRIVLEVCETPIGGGRSKAESVAASIPCSVVDSVNCSVAASVLGSRRESALVELMTNIEGEHNTKKAPSVVVALEMEPESATEREPLGVTQKGTEGGCDGKGFMSGHRSQSDVEWEEPAAEIMVAGPRAASPELWSIVALSSDERPALHAEPVLAMDMVARTAMCLKSDGDVASQSRPFPSPSTDSDPVLEVDCDLAAREHRAERNDATSQASLLPSPCLLQSPPLMASPSPEIDMDMIMTMLLDSDVGEKLDVELGESNRIVNVTDAPPSPVRPHCGSPAARTNVIPTINATSSRTVSPEIAVPIEDRPIIPRVRSPSAVSACTSSPPSSMRTRARAIRDKLLAAPTPVPSQSSHAGPLFVEFSAAVVSRGRRGRVGGRRCRGRGAGRGREVVSRTSHNGRVLDNAVEMGNEQVAPSGPVSELGGFGEAAVADVVPVVQVSLPEDVEGAVELRSRGGAPSQKETPVHSFVPTTKVSRPTRTISSVRSFLNNGDEDDPSRDSYGSGEDRIAGVGLRKSVETRDVRWTPPADSPPIAPRSMIGGARATSAAMARLHRVSGNGRGSARRHPNLKVLPRKETVVQEDVRPTSPLHTATASPILEAHQPIIVESTPKSINVVDLTLSFPARPIDLSTPSPKRSVPMRVETLNAITFPSSATYTSTASPRMSLSRSQSRSPRASTESKETGDPRDEKWTKEDRARWIAEHAGCPRVIGGVRIEVCLDLLCEI
ncbi:hypothetical protein HDU93_008977 [Gonapodya sp. JEL0774]|nr:hypothetical protein HDU93_008977 [Gonapodya sp. JEL0774]